MLSLVGSVSSSGRADNSPLLCVPEPVAVVAEYCYVRICNEHLGIHSHTRTVIIFPYSVVCDSSLGWLDGWMGLGVRNMPPLAVTCPFNVVWPLRAKC